MNRIFLISAVCMQFGWISGASNNNGVGAYAYQDSNGNRYGGTYGLNDEQVHRAQQSPGFPGFNPVPFGPDLDDFFPEYFRNFENLLQDRRAIRAALLEPLPPLPPLQPLRPCRRLAHFRPLHMRPLRRLRPLVPFRPLQPLPPLQPLTPLGLCPSESLPPRRVPFRHLQKHLFPNLKERAFDSNSEYQRQALETARKAYDITSNQAGFIPNIDFSRFTPFGAAPGFGSGFGMNNRFGSQNAAYASGVAAPGYTHQMAAISPGNPNMPNVDITNRFADTAPAGGNGFMGVSSSSFASSSNVNGKETSHRKAETIINNNGKVTHYKVEDK